MNGSQHQPKIPTSLIWCNDNEGWDEFDLLYIALYFLWPSTILSFDFFIVYN